MKKVIAPGLITGVVTLILGMAVSYLFMRFPAVATDYANTNIMRPWSDPVMSLFFIYPFVQGIILAWAWNKTKTIFSSKGINRGVKFGLSIWLIATIPGMLISYSSFPFSLLTILSWLVGGLINNITMGIIFARLNK